MSAKVFGNYSSPMDLYISRSEGGYARLVRKLPFRKLTPWLSAQLRMNFIIKKEIERWLF
jgi:hypothetical protein